MSCCGGCGFGGKGGAGRGLCLCGGQACAQCSEFVSDGVVLMTLGGEGSQSMDFLGPAVASAFLASKIQQKVSLRRLRLTGCRGTYCDVRARCLGGIASQRPLNEAEDPFVTIFDVGTETCSAPLPRFRLPTTCPSCGRGPDNWVIRPCGHAACGSCVLQLHSCTVCGNRDIGEASDNAIVAAEVVDADTTIFHHNDGSTKRYTHEPQGEAEQVVQYLAAFCTGNELKTVLSMLTATASFSMGPTALSEDDELGILSMAVMGADRLVIAHLIYALRKDVLGLGYWWHGIMSCIVRLFCNVGFFRGRPVYRENVCRALGYWKQVTVAEKTRAAVTIQAYTRRWLARRADPKRNAAAVRIQALWRGWSYRRVCCVCLEMGARTMQCKCRGTQGRAHADCIVDGFKAAGEWTGRCTVCKAPYTGTVGLWVAGHAHNAYSKSPIFNPDVILQLVELQVDQGSNTSINAAYQSLHALGRHLSRTDPRALGGRIRHEEYRICVQIQLALAEARDDKLHEAVNRLKGTMAGCMSVFGLDHPLSLKIQMHIAKICFDSGEVKAAYDIMSPLLDELIDTFGPNSAEALYYGKMTLAASALILVDRYVNVKTRHFFFNTFETLRKEFGPAHPYTLTVIRWRQGKRVGLAYTTSQQIEHECATKIQALWRGWAYRRPCYLCKKLGASNTCCKCRGPQRWAHPECRAKVAAAELCVLCHHCGERHTGWFGVKVVSAVTREEERRGILNVKTCEHNRGDVQYALALAKCRAPFPERWDPVDLLDEIHVTNSDPRMVVWTQIAYGFLEYRQGKLVSAELRLDMAISAAVALALKEPEHKMWWYMAMAYHGAVLVAMERYEKAEGRIKNYMSILNQEEHAFAAYYGRPAPWNDTANKEFTLFYGKVPLAFCRWKLGREEGKLDFSIAVAELRRDFGNSHDFVRYWLKMAGHPV